MSPPARSVFVDTGAWVALAVVQDPLHERAKEIWQKLSGSSVRLYTSVPVTLETFTFLDRRGSRDLALRWRDSLRELPNCKMLGVSAAHLDEAWGWFKRKDLYKLSLVDATSFVLMRANKIKTALAFDAHFSIAGFQFAS